MNFIVEDKNNKTLFTGTRQECAHFIKRRAFKRNEIILKKLNNEPAVHYTVPVTGEQGENLFSKSKPKSFFKRIFDK